MPDSPAYYHRNLPHWHPPGTAVFLTYRLYGSLPEKVMLQMEQTQKLFVREIEKAEYSVEAVAELKLVHYKKLFARIDAILDRAESGPCWLGLPEVANLVQDVLLQRYSELYSLWAYVVMSNHVHMLLRPKSIDSSNRGSASSYAAVSRIMKSIKGYTAREANRILKRTGQQFWQQESFDHWARDEAEFFRIIQYIENNPVKAGLVKQADNWLWSSAAERKRRGWTTVQSLT